MSENIKRDSLAVAKATIEAEAAAMLEGAKRLDGNFKKAVDVILAHKGKIVICGVGKSGLVGQKIAATLSSTGTPAVFLHACDAVHGDLGVYSAGDPTLLISNSGATVECLRLMPTLKQFKSPIIALIGKLDSPMGKSADIVLDASVVREADPLGIVPTSSAVLAMALGDALACALIEARGFSKTDFARFHPAGQLGRNLTLSVEDVMAKLESCALVSAEDSIRQIVIKMTQKPLGAACVVDEFGKLVGIVTDGDLRRMLQNVCDIDSEKCLDIMTKTPVCVSPEAPLIEAANLMEKRKSKLSVLPVVGANGACMGLIRIHDIYQQ